MVVAHPAAVSWSVRAALTSLIVLSSACATTTRTVRNVTIEGNERVDDGDLTEGLANHAPSGIVFQTEADYQPLQLVLDEQRIETSYREQGFFSAQVLGSKVTEIGPHQVDIAFQVREGPPTLLERVEVHGAPAEAGVDATALGLAGAMEIDHPLEYESYLAAGDRIQAQLFNFGYAYARVDKRLEVDRDRGKATALFYVDAGPKAVFGSVRIEGLERTPQSVVTERIAWQPGEQFDPKKLERTRVQVYSTGLLGNVRFTWDTEKRAEVLDIVVHASEGTRHEIRLGGGVGIDAHNYEVRGRFGYTHRNFLDPRTTLRAAARPGLAFLPSGSFLGWKVDAEVSLERQDMFAPMWMGKVALDYTLSEVDAYSYQGPGLRLSYGRRWWNDEIVLSLTGQTRFQDFLRIEPAVEAIADGIGLHDPLALIAFEPSVTYDNRDDRQVPNEGAYVRLALEIGRVVTGDAHSYLKFTPELRGYHTIFGDWLVGAARIKIGSTVPDLGRLPVTQRFASGGSEGQRGFSRGRLSPMVPNRDGEMVPIGGEALFEVAAELRIDLFLLLENQLRLVLFVDGADVAMSFGELKVPNLHYATGAGLRYDTPIGPVRVDFGVRLNRLGPTEPDPDERFAFHLSLGEAF